MQEAGHIWAIKQKEDEANPSDWVYRNAVPTKPRCTARGNDASPGLTGFANEGTGIADERRRQQSCCSDQKPTS